MSSTILNKILSQKRLRIEEAKRRVMLDRLVERARDRRDVRDLAVAISTPGRINIIAEFKRASPSKGLINDLLDPAQVARMYENGGAAAISVLTDEDFFKGSLDDLLAVRSAVDLPILRKDFIIDEYQIYESAAAGADAILLIVSALTVEELSRFQNLASELGLGAIVEVHESSEMEIAVSIGAKIIGVNNRDLKTFKVSLDVSRELIEHAPKDSIMLTESGLRTRDDLIGLRSIGYSAFLIGESLMKSGSPEDMLKRLSIEKREFA
jgi:indole-3-glycerol phosphate synthase